MPRVVGWRLYNRVERGRRADEWERVGANKRYADAVDKRMASNTDAIIMRDRKSVSLSDAELELDRLPLTRTPTPERVRVWVRYGDIALKVDAEVVA